MQKALLAFLFLVVPYFIFSQNVSGLWKGKFLMYPNNSFDVEMNIANLSKNTFTAKLNIYNEKYKGEYTLSGSICNYNQLEITAIILIKENGPSNWVDCLNGTLLLNGNYTYLSFNDSLKSLFKNNQKYSTCKVKFVQHDMFQCLKSANLYKLSSPPPVSVSSAFDALWNKFEKQPNKTAETPKKEPEPEVKIEPAPKEPEIIVKTEPIEKNEIVEIKKEAEPILIKKIEPPKIEPKVDTQFADRERVVLSEIKVANRTILIEYWDKFNFDYDSISIYLNDEPVLENVLVRTEKQKLSLVMENGSNYLVIHALNLGREPPNTSAVNITDGKKVYKLTLYSDLTKSGTVKIVFDP